MGTNHARQGPAHPGTGPPSPYGDGGLPRLRERLGHDRRGMPRPLLARQGRRPLQQPHHHGQAPVVQPGIRQEQNVPTRNHATPTSCSTNSWRKPGWEESSDLPGNPNGGRLPPRPSWTSPTWTPCWKLHQATSSQPRPSRSCSKLKIRRGDATVRAWDHNVWGLRDHGQTDVARGRRHPRLWTRPVNAYRQWPVRQPSHNATFLHTRHGLTLWFRMAMCFEPRRQCGTSTKWLTPCSLSLACSC